VPSSYWPPSEAAKPTFPHDAHGSTLAHGQASDFAVASNYGTDANPEETPDSAPSPSGSSVSSADPPTTTPDSDTAANSNTTAPQPSSRHYDPATGTFTTLDPSRTSGRTEDFLKAHNVDIFVFQKRATNIIISSGTISKIERLSAHRFPIAIFTKASYDRNVLRKLQKVGTNRQVVVFYSLTGLNEGGFSFGERLAMIDALKEIWDHIVIFTRPIIRNRNDDPATGRRPASSWKRPRRGGSSRRTRAQTGSGSPRPVGIESWPCQEPGHCRSTSLR
jgi:hypothetical protein